MIRAWLVTVALPSAVLAQTHGGFVVRLGRDTIAVERFVRSADRLEGDLISRNITPVLRRHYVATLRPDGSVSRFELANTRLFAAGATTPGIHGVFTFTGDSLIGSISYGDSTAPFGVATPQGAMPFLDERSFALYEQYGRRAHAIGGNTVKITGIGVPSGSPTDLVVMFPAADSLAIITGKDRPTRFRRDTSGAILDVDGRESADKVVAERVPDLDVNALAVAFGDRPLGVLSPPDSAIATIAGTSVAVRYSRPSMRGRKVFGELVPWNDVWRTGANYATRLTISSALGIGGATVPAGSYSVWTIPSATGWKLVLNRQTKAACQTAAACADPRRPALWGTDYNADSDFVRVDMRTEPLGSPVEQFRIRIEPRGGGGALVMEWETTRASVPITKP